MLFNIKLLIYRFFFYIQFYFEIYPLNQSTRNKRLSFSKWTIVIHKEILNIDDIKIRK